MGKKFKNKGFTLQPLNRVNKSGLKYTEKGAGFTLIEVIVAIAIILTTIVGLSSLSSFSISSLETAKSKVIAVNLAQEGVEIVRNMRDSNWLIYRDLIDQGQPQLWLTGLDPGTYQAQYDSLTLTPITSPTILYKDSNGFYQYGTTPTPTPFKRRILIDQIPDPLNPGQVNEIKITSEITWSEKGKNNTITVEDHLYNWFK